MAAPINDVFVLFGDSQTEFASRPGGFANRLAQHYSRVFDVVNRGFSGYTTDQARVLAQRIFQPQREAPGSSPSWGHVRLATVWFGSNDAAVPGHRQHVPLERYRSNLLEILDTIETNAPLAKVVLLTPAPLIPGTDLVGATRRPELTRSYVDTIVEVASQRSSSRVAVIDLFSMFEQLAASHLPSVQALLGEDGLHISDLGYELIFQRLIKTINFIWPELDRRNLQTTYPLWRDLLPEPGDDSPPAVPLESRPISTSLR